MTLRTVVAFVAALVVCLGLAACGSAGSSSGAQASSQSASGERAASVSPSSATTQESAASEVASAKKVAKDAAEMQTSDPSLPTRIPMEGGTKINMHFGDTVIPGVLNDSETARALIEKLPVTQHVSRYSHDFCGVTENLPYSEDEVHYGWLNGDIDYAIDAPYFTILFEDEDVSEQYGSQVNIGVITCPLQEISSLEGPFDVRIELAK